MAVKNNESVANEATFDTHGGVNFSETPGVVPGINAKEEIVSSLQDYMREADENRKNGQNPRDAKWQQNLDLYWNRYDFTKKAQWQAQETMPEVPNFVDRFAAALKEALIATPEGFYTIEDPADRDHDVSSAIKRATDVMLTTVGRNQTGQMLPFSAVFEEQVKMGALMNTAAVVTWKNDVPGGRVAVETTDPRFVWLDHTYRNLYRIRRIELDRHELIGLKMQVDGRGEKIFNEVELARLETSLQDKTERDAERTGSGVQTPSARRPIILDEYIATIIGSDGSVLADRSLIVLANQNYIIRGPEKNPFWHGKDWLVTAPLITTPLSVYGRTYMEDFGALAKTFTDLTNMILDAVHTSSLKAYAMVPGMLLNPNQVAEGISPNKIFMLDDGYKADDFAKELTLGTLSPDAVKIWQAIKSELSEDAGMNEIGLGQFAPNSRTSATEINETQQSSSAIVRSVAQTLETRFVDPALDLIWKTGLQHATANNKAMINAVGEDMWQAMVGTKKEFIKRPVTFQARGISSLISRSNQLKTLLGILSIVSQNEILMNIFMQKVDPQKLFDKIFQLSGIDLSKLAMTEREKMIASVAQPLQQAGQAASGAPAGTQGQEQGIAQAVSSLGIGR